MKIEIKKFTELSINELYSLLQLRSEVFVVEQNCVYQDIDDKDQKALHVLVKKEGKIIGYTRIFNVGDYLSEASIGRVLVKKEERKHCYGKTIMLASINAIKEYFKEDIITISAQLYLKKFYTDLGFIVEGKEYLEDNIPHIKMIKK